MIWLLRALCSAALLVVDTLLLEEGAGSVSAEWVMKASMPRCGPICSSVFSNGHTAEDEFQ